MALSRRGGAMALLLLGVLLIICSHNSASASSSGGVMGGSFFDSDSSSSEKTFPSDHWGQATVRREREHGHERDSDGTEHASHGGVHILFLIFMFGLFLVGFCRKDNNGNAITVIKLQVAMLGGKGKSIQRDLTRIAEAADTSSPEGVSHLLTETILALHQHLGYCVAGYSSVGLKQNKEDGERCYNQQSKEERTKFDEETLVNLNREGKVTTRSQSANVCSNDYTMLDVKKKSKEEGKRFEEEKLLNGFGNEYIVITILVAAKGAHKLPSIEGAEDLKRALQKLRSLLSSNLLAGEVLWTPQKEDDTISERELLEDYPQLAKNMESFLVKKHE